MKRLLQVLILLAFTLAISLAKNSKVKKHQNSKNISPDVKWSCKIKHSPLLSDGTIHKEIKDLIELVVERSKVTEGIFRVPGNNHVASETLKLLKKGKHISWQEIDSHSVVLVLQRIIKSCVFPLADWSVGKLIAADGFTLKLFYDSLCSDKKVWFDAIFNMFHTISLFSDKNRMNSKNLALIIAPNVFENYDISDLTSIISVLEDMISNCHTIHEENPVKKNEKQEPVIRRNNGSSGDGRRASFRNTLTTVLIRTKIKAQTDIEKIN